MAKYMPDPVWEPLSLKRSGRSVLAEGYRVRIERGGQSFFLHAVRFHGKEDEILVAATSLASPTEEVLPLLWGRWGIENSFKFYLPFRTSRARFLPPSIGRSEGVQVCEEGWRMAWIASAEICSIAVTIWWRRRPLASQSV